MAKEAVKPKTKPAAKKTNSESVVKKSKRRVKPAKYKSFKLSKKIKRDDKKLPSARKIFIRSLRHLWAHKKLFLKLLVIAAILNIFLVKGFTTVNNVEELKEIIQSFTEVSTNRLYEGFTIFSVLVGNSSSASTDVGSTYQYILVVILSLAYIWTLRKTFLPKVAIRAKDAFYQGMYPLIPFLIVIFIIGLQLIPMVMAAFLYQTVVAGGLAANNLEAAIWLILTSLLSLLSLYMITSSIFSLYIVTLPRTGPLQALRSARGLVLHRRWTIMRKFLFLPLVFMIIAALLVIPTIIVAPWFAEWLLYLLGVAGLLVGHSYGYHLYRELL
jgi:hypothetical protein